MDSVERCNETVLYLDFGVGYTNVHVIKIA